jgi:hypothetical protein
MFLSGVWRPEAQRGANLSSRWGHPVLRDPLFEEVEDFLLADS